MTKGGQSLEDLNLMTYSTQRKTVQTVLSRCQPVVTKAPKKDEVRVNSHHVTL